MAEDGNEEQERARQRYEQAQRRGRAGEQEAERFLIREKGFRLLHRNWKEEQYEIDRVMMDREVLVFVEVRTRQIGGLVPGFYSLTARKRAALREACRKFLYSHRGRYPHFRLDVVEVNLSDEAVVEVLHFQNIPCFSKYQGY